MVGGALVAVAWLQVAEATEPVTELTTEHGGVPVTLLLPPTPEPAPAVVVVHGFAGSRQLMRSTGIALAGAGYAVALPDLTGHGANPRPLRPDRDLDRLVADVAAAMDALADRPEVDPARVGLLGHSMGSGAAMAAGIAPPDRVRAVVAVSPTDAEVSAEVPRDLLLVAGAREPRFVTNAEDLLARAGGPGAQPGDGTARALVVVPHVEHVGILFSPAMHRTAARWFDAALGHGPSQVLAVPLIAWWSLHLVGVLLVWRTAVALTHRTSPRAARLVPAHRAVLGVLGGGALATVLLLGLAPALPLVEVAGMLVAPVLAAWFALAGAAWLLAGATPGRPAGRDLAIGVAVLVGLVVAFGVLAHRTWLPWFPIAPRVAPAAAFAVLVLPWTLALAATLQGRRGVSGFLWWAGITAGLLVGVGAAALVVPGLGFVALVLPLLPAVLGLTQVVWAPLERPWAAGLGSAAFLGWLLAVLFPLA